MQKAIKGPDRKHVEQFKQKNLRVNLLKTNMKDLNQQKNTNSQALDVDMAWVLKKKLSELSVYFNILDLQFQVAIENIKTFYDKHKKVIFYDY